MTGVIEPEVQEQLPVAPPPRRRSHAARWIAGSVAVLAVLFAGLLATRENAESRLASSPLVGRLAPEVTGETVDGDVVRLSELRGRYVVLNFFATWCVPCQREHDDLLAFHERHRATGDAEVLAVVFDDEVDRVRRFFAQEGGDWPVLADPNGKVALDFGVRGPPESYLISPEGLVLGRIVGEVTDAQLEAFLAADRRARAEAGR